jgi:hypothetical protein
MKDRKHLTEREVDKLIDATKDSRNAARDRKQNGNKAKKPTLTSDNSQFTTTSR